MQHDLLTCTHLLVYLLQIELKNVFLKPKNLAPELIALLTAHLYHINREVKWLLEWDEIIDEDDEMFDEICLAEDAGKQSCFSYFIATRPLMLSFLSSLSF